VQQNNWTMAGVLHIQAQSHTSASNAAISSNTAGKVHPMLLENVG
jgi:hypothetical protein